MASPRRKKNDARASPPPCLAFGDEMDFVPPTVPGFRTSVLRASQGQSEGESQGKRASVWSDGTQSEVAIKTNQTALPSALLPLCYQLYLAVRPSSLSGVVRGAGVKESSLVAPRPKTRDLNNLFVVGASVCISGDGASSAATAQGDDLRR